MRIFLLILTVFLSACGGKGGGGGSGGGTPVALCQDLNATNRGNPLPCACPSGYLPNENSTACLSQSLCMDVNASNQGSPLPCSCNSGYLPNVGGTSCVAQGGGGSQAPNSLIYSTMPNPLTLFIDQAILTPYAPTVNNCTSGCSYTISPTLPSGMNLNSTTGVISGIPTVLRGSQNYEIRATNSYGHSSSIINFRVVPRAPNGLVITENNAIYIKDRVISTNNISYSSGKYSVNSMTISPSLPNGLFLVPDNSAPELPTFRISGTPTVASPLTTYTITAIGPTTPNASINLQIQVIEPPTVYTYNNISHPNCALNSGILECSFEKLTFFDPLIPTSNGDGVRYKIRSTSPNAELPSGLGISSVNGNIFTTQYGSLETKLCATPGQFCDYQLEAYIPGYEADNSLKAFTTIRLKVTAGSPPNNFTYPAPPIGSSYTFRKLEALPGLSPIFSGSTPDCITTPGCFSISPSLPTGLIFSSSTGSISGTPQVNFSLQTYTITANDSRGSVSGQVSFEVLERLPVLTYSKNEVIFHIGEDLLASSTFLSVNQLSVNNDIPINSFSISPALPSGLLLNTGAFIVGQPENSGGTIYGTANTLSEETDYILSACNSGGCTNISLKITVNPVVSKVVSGERHSCALVRTSPNINDLGRVICWGANDHNQLGNSNSESCTDSSSNIINCIKKGSYVLNGINPLSNVRDLSAGNNHNCALIDNTPGDENLKSNVYCWGDNSFGQLSQNSLTPINSVIPLIGKKTGDVNINSVIKIESGGNSTCLISLEPSPEDSEIEAPYVYCFGENYSPVASKIGYNNDSRLALLINDLSLGQDHACANSLILNSQYEVASFAVKCWGRNDRGQLGNNSTSGTFSTVPSIVQVESGGNINDAIEFHSGNKFSCVKRDANPSDSVPGTAQCWGSNDEGQLSLGTYGGQSLRAKNMMGVSNLVNIGGGSDYVTLSVDSSSGIIAKIVGRLPLSGSPYPGSNSALPINLKKNQSSGIVDYLVFSSLTKSANSKDSYCNRTSQSKVECFGKNDVGQLGDNSIIDSVLPVTTKIVP